LTGLTVSCIAFVLAYKVFGQAADLLPLLFAETIALGVLGSKVFPSKGHWVRSLASLALAIGAGVLFATHIPARGPNSTGVYAGPYLQELDLASFPGPAVICAEWPESVPIRYAQCVQARRKDLHVVTSAPDLWGAVYRKEGRPVFVTDVVDLESPCSGEAFRNVYRMRCPKHETDQSSLP
jgi:hypothetical protein